MMLANNCLETHPADMENCYHSFEGHLVNIALYSSYEVADARHIYGLET